MPISGLVLTFSEALSPMHPAISLLRKHRHIEMGLSQGRRLPIVVDTPDPTTDRAVWQWLNHLPSIFHIDVAMVSFDEQPAGPCAVSPTHELQPLTIRDTEF